MSEDNKDNGQKYDIDKDLEAAASLSMIKEYYEEIRYKLKDVENPETLVILGMMLLSFSLPIVITDEKQKFLGSHILECCNKLSDMLQYDDVKIHKEVINLIDMVFMDLKALRNNLSSKYVN